MAQLQFKDNHDFQFRFDEEGKRIKWSVVLTKGSEKPPKPNLFVFENEKIYKISGVLGKEPNKTHTIEFDELKITKEQKDKKFQKKYLKSSFYVKVTPILGTDTEAQSAPVIAWENIIFKDTSGTDVQFLTLFIGSDDLRIERAAGVNSGHVISSLKTGSPLFLETEINQTSGIGTITFYQQYK